MLESLIWGGRGGGLVGEVCGAQWQTTDGNINRLPMCNNVQGRCR